MNNSKENKIPKKVSKNRYHMQQMEIAFQKKLKIIKDNLSHLYYKDLLIESFFQPLDAISGDMYATFEINKGVFLFYIIDAMGKGLSASVTAIQSSTFLNHATNKASKSDDFDLHRLIWDYLEFIKQNLLEDELLCVVFLLLDTNKNKINIANFGMPPVLFHKGCHICDIKPNNLPIMKHYHECNIEDMDTKDIEKILIYSDGLDEIRTIDGNIFATEIKNIFFETYTKNQFIKEYKKRIEENNDDVSAIFITKIPQKQEVIYEKNINSSTTQINKIFKELDLLFKNFTTTNTIISEFIVSLNEMLLNALEHGNYEIGFDEKSHLISQDLFDEELEKKSKNNYYLSRIISLKISKFSYCNQEFLSAITTDEGSGFNVRDFFKSLSFNSSNLFNGRGIFMSNSLNDGLYYNDIGNSSILLKMIKKDN